MSDNVFSDDDYCFACGTGNPIGLKLRFTITEERLYTDFCLPKEYQGWTGVVHGGILTLIMDEVQVNAAAAKGYIAPTAEITSRIIRPVMAGARYPAEARITDIKRERLIFTEAFIADEAGEVCCRSSARLIVTGKADPGQIRTNNETHR
ncbi:MAG: PaaI family thioesterase [Abditibacteriota bacterium]|nr:PaaI family thioesterase [Abditibacteriota bacterium]